MKKKVLLKGPLLTRSGYGEQARFALRALRSREDLFDVFIQPLQWGKTSWSSEMDAERVWIDQTIEKTIAYIQQGGQFDMSLQVTIPNEFQRLAPINIGYTAGIETTKVAHQWIQKANEMDKIIVVSSHSKQVFENTEYQATNQQTGENVILRTQTPVEAVGYPVKTFESLPELNLELSTQFNFLTVAQFGPRKNLHNTIKWFIEEFRNEDVGLVVKSNIAKNSLLDRKKLHGDLTKFLRQQGERQCKVYLLHGDMTDAEMHSLYQHPQIHAFVSLPHGEGFGLPLFEAAYSGLPVVATGWSGQLDFLTDAKGRDQFYNVAFDLQPVQKEVVWDGVITGDSMWAYAREGSAKEQMRACFEQTTGNADTNLRLNDYAQQLRERFSAEKMHDQFVGEVLGRSNLKPKPVTGISFCISTNGAKPEKTELEIKSIHKTMEPVDIPYEIIVAGNTSPFAEMGITAVHTPEDADNGLLAKLRNNAGEVAKHDVLVFVDDDFIFPETWASRFVEYSKTNGWDVTANKILSPDGSRFWDRATINPHCLVSYDHPSYDNKLYQTGGFWIMRKALFESHRWDSSIAINSEKNGGINEDVEMSIRIQREGFTLEFDSQNTVWHNDKTYSEFNNLTLKNEIISKQLGIAEEILNTKQTKTVFQLGFIFMKKMIIGLGTGRCGSMSLSNLLSFQEGCLVSHEIGGRPWLPWKKDTKLFENYYKLIHSRNYEIVGDVSFYNLPYASDYLNKSQKTVFVILQRDKQDTINSYLKKTEGRNHWIAHNGSKWRLDSWDKCYPKFDVTEKEEALSDYYDHYYESCETLPQEKCFWMKTQDLNNEQKCIEMLNFCGFESPSFIKLKRNSSS